MIEQHKKLIKKISEIVETDSINIDENFIINDSNLDSLSILTLMSAIDQIYQIKKFNNINIVGQAEKKTSVISFLIDETHPFDVGTLLDQMGIAIRTGHHCTQPLMDFYEIPGTARVSLAFYNTKEEIDYFMESLKRVIRLLS